MKSSKLKPDTFGLIKMIIVAISLFVVISYVKLTAEPEIKKVIVGTMWSIFALIQLVFWLKTANLGFLAFMIFCLLVSWSYFTDYKGIYFIIPALILLVVYLYYVIRKKFNYRYRDILELAAKPIKDTQDGFTSRPLPAGSVSISKNQLLKFGKYLSKNLIAFPFIEKDRLFLVINSFGKHWIRKPKVSKDTYICIDFKGKVTVNIAKKDYSKYQEELTFDQLCQSLGNLFKEFFEYFNHGQNHKILDALENKELNTSQ